MELPRIEQAVVGCNYMYLFTVIMYNIDGHQMAKIACKCHANGLNK